MEVALRELLAPLAKQLGLAGAPPHLGSQEGRHVWQILLDRSPHVVQRCVGIADKSPSADS